ncbi:MAG: hypothetical protein ACI4PM_00595 [Butyricicoccus sp.]
MVRAQEMALRQLWTDRCTVYGRQKVMDSESHLTDFVDAILLEDEPCRLSFSSLSTADGDPAAAATQTVKLFLSNEAEIPAGCKIVVTQRNGRQHIFASSGVPAVYSCHQEILLSLWKGYA